MFENNEFDIKAFEKDANAGVIEAQLLLGNYYRIDKSDTDLKY